MSPAFGGGRNLGTTQRRSAGHLLRALGFTFAMAICVGTIGGGILRTPGAVADRVPDPCIILLLWTMGGVHALLGANVVAEISRSVPKAGGLIVASCLNVVVMVLPRILYGLGRDGLFVSGTTRVNKGGTPDVALALSGALTLTLELTGTFETVFLLMGALVM